MILTILLVTVVFQRPPAIKEKGSEFAALQRKGITAAPAGTTKPKRRGGRDRERDSAAQCQRGPGSDLLPTRRWGYLHHVHVLLSQFVQAGQHFQSLSRKARKEKKTLRAKFAMHFPLQFAVHMELLVEVHITDIR